MREIPYLCRSLMVVAVVAIFVMVSYPASSYIGPISGIAWSLFKSLSTSSNSVILVICLVSVGLVVWKYPNEETENVHERL